LRTNNIFFAFVTLSTKLVYKISHLGIAKKK